MAKFFDFYFESWKQMCMYLQAVLIAGGLTDLEREYLEETGPRIIKLMEEYYERSSCGGCSEARTAMSQATDLEKQAKKRFEEGGLPLSRYEFLKTIVEGVVYKIPFCRDDHEALGRVFHHIDVIQKRQGISEMIEETLWGSVSDREGNARIRDFAKMSELIRTLKTNDRQAAMLNICLYFINLNSFHLYSVLRRYADHG